MNAIFEPSSVTAKKETVIQERIDKEREKEEEGGVSVSRSFGAKQISFIPEKAKVRSNHTLLSKFLFVVSSSHFLGGH